MTLQDEIAGCGLELGSRHRDTESFGTEFQTGRGGFLDTQLSFDPFGLRFHQCHELVVVPAVIDIIDYCLDLVPHECGHPAVPVEAAELRLAVNRPHTRRTARCRSHYRDIERPATKVENQ